MPKISPQKQIVNYFVNAIRSILLAYSPLTAKQLKSKFKKYFKELFEAFEEKDFNDILDHMADIESIAKEGELYSMIPFDVLEIYQDSVLKDFQMPEKKFKSGLELLEKTNPSKTTSIEEAIELREYLESLNIKKKKKVLIDRLLDSIYFFGFTDIVDNLVDTLPEETDFEYVYDMIQKIYMQLPMYYLRGNSITEHTDYLEKNNKLQDFIQKQGTENYYDSDSYVDKKIKEYPPKKDYKDFSYEECMDLANKFDMTKLCRMVDSDRFLELTINGEKRYVSVLGYHNKDYGIIVYPTYEDLRRMYPFILAESSNEYPDMAFHFDAIEICMSDPKGIASDDIRGELKDKKLPLYPSFIRLKTNHARRLVNQEEMNIVGGVLSDLLRMMANTDFSDIVTHLGDKNDKYEDINQVYVLEDETIFGAYFDPDLGDTYLNFDLAPLNKKRLKELKSLKDKRHLLLGLFLSPFHVNDYYPYMFVIKDVQSGLVINMDVVEEKDLSNIVDVLLFRLIESGIRPISIGTNNEYCYKVFEELEDALNINYYIDESGEINEMYDVILNIGPEEEDFFS